MFGQIFLPPKVKQIVIIRNKHGLYDLPTELRLEQEISGKYQIFKEL